MKLETTRGDGAITVVTEPCERHGGTFRTDIYTDADAFDAMANVFTKDVCREIGIRSGVAAIWALEPCCHSHTEPHARRNHRQYVEAVDSVLLARLSAPAADAGAEGAGK